MKLTTIVQCTAVVVDENSQGGLRFASVWRDMLQLSQARWQAVSAAKSWKRYVPRESPGKARGGGAQPMRGRQFRSSRAGWQPEATSPRRPKLSAPEAIVTADGATTHRIGGKDLNHEASLATPGPPPLPQQRWRLSRPLRACACARPASPTRPPSAPPP